jgi:ubiquinone/menaquinone biosynthesis C-methylase UbiE
MDHSEELKKLYNNWGATYDFDAEHNIAIIKVHPVALDILRNEPQKDIGLDLGCGTGILTMKMSEFSEEVIGLDYSEGMLAEARKKAARNPKIKFIQANINEKLPFEPATFDYVISVLALHHLENLQNT